MTVASHLVLLILTSQFLLLGQVKSDSLSSLLASPRKDSAEWHRNVGRAYYVRGKIEPTLKHLQQAIRLDPTNEQLYLDLGQVLA